MSDSPETQVILFSDICGSTRLYERLGNQHGQRLVDQCLSAMTVEVERWGGHLVKTIGDEVMARFDRALDASRAAVGLNERIEGIAQLDPNAPRDLAVRTGFHLGAIIWDKGDIYGDAVNVAARLAALAKPHQILTSGASVAYLPTSLPQCAVRFLDRTVVKGRQEPVDLFEILRESDEMTRVAGAQPTPTTALNQRLRLIYRDQRRVISVSELPLHLGRGDQADVVVASPLASRDHAKIEARGHNFFVIDHSTNGTYLISGGHVQFLRREAVALQSRGFLSLGASPEEADEEDYIRFAVEADPGSE